MRQWHDTKTGFAAGQFSRRQFLKATIAGAAVVAARSLGLPAFAAGAAKATAKARAVIQIWMWGGPSHLDTFDPKPDAGSDYTGPFAKPIATNVPGLRINELLPLLARQADKYSIVRSLTHGINGHETAAYLVQTGRPPGGRLSFPCAGAVVSLFKGRGAVRRGGDRGPGGVAPAAAGPPCRGRRGRPSARPASPPAPSPWSG
jgi:hypothetical protein